MSSRVVFASFRVHPRWVVTESDDPTTSKVGHPLATAPRFSRRSGGLFASAASGHRAVGGPGAAGCRQGEWVPVRLTVGTPGSPPDPRGGYPASRHTHRTCHQRDDPGPGNRAGVASSSSAVCVAGLMSCGFPSPRLPRRRGAPAGTCLGVGVPLTTSMG